MKKEKRFKNRILFPFILCMIFLPLPAQEIAVNQIGYHKYGTKLAVVPASAGEAFYITLPGSDEILYSGYLNAEATWAPAQQSVKIADFSGFEEVGTFVLKIENSSLESYEFEISTSVYEDVAKASLKAFYFIRASTALPEEYAGKWARTGGHYDTVVYIHPSAASENRPANTIISSPKGWYDAGDYNKYVVNSGITTHALMSFFEHYKDVAEKLTLNIPEKDNPVPDILDEAKWNLDWLLTMQDPFDGGVYHKCTGKNFDGFIMPRAYKQARYVVMKSTTATLDFAALMAQAARVYAEFEDEFPGFSATCLQAALNAWKWARKNPAVRYVQPADVSTGEYGDGNPADEFSWAARELYITTKSDSFYSVVNTNLSVNTPGWPNVHTLGVISLLANEENLTETGKAGMNAVRNSFFNLADNLYNSYVSSAYKVPNSSFYWGINGDIAYKGSILTIAHRLSGDKKYLSAAQACVDYLLGRNPNGYSFVTGYGDKPPMFIHHRPSGADGIADPIPGLVAGGANPQNMYDCGESQYPSTIPALAFVDKQCSYSTNEICINWQAPLVFLLNAYSASLKVQPVLIQAATDTTDNRLVWLDFSIGLDRDFHDTAGFSISWSDSLFQADSVWINQHDSLSLALHIKNSIPAEADSLFLHYSPGTLKSFDGEPVVEIEAFPVTNLLPGSSPVVLHLKTDVSGKIVSLFLSKDIDEVLPDSQEFNLLINDTPVQIDSLKIAETALNELQIFINREIISVEDVTLSFTGKNLTSSDGGGLKAFNSLPVENNSAPIPVFLDASTSLDGDYLSVIFSEELISGTQDADFTVLSNDTDISIDSITVSGEDRTSVKIYLQDLLTNEDSVLLSYGTGALLSVQNKAVPSFGPVLVENIVYMPVEIPGKVEAEYWYTMEGFQTQETEDEGGGLNIGWTDIGDFLIYKILVNETDTYTVQYRVAALEVDGTIELKLDEEVIDVADFEATGGWQNWITVENCVHLHEGPHMLTLTAISDLFNVNWLNFEQGCTVVVSNNIHKSLNVRLYPNPFTDRLNVQTGHSISGIRIMDITGKIILVENFSDHATFDLSHFRKGIYIAEVSVEGNKSRMILIRE